MVVMAVCPICGDQLYEGEYCTPCGGKLYDSELDGDWSEE